MTDKPKRQPKAKPKTAAKPRGKKAKTMSDENDNPPVETAPEVPQVDTAADPQLETVVETAAPAETVPVDDGQEITGPSYKVTSSGDIVSHEGKSLDEDYHIHPHHRFIAALRKGLHI